MTCAHDQLYREAHEQAGGTGCPLCNVKVSTCPVCGCRFQTSAAGPFVCPDCLAEEQAEREERSDNARPYLN